MSILVRLWYWFRTWLSMWVPSTPDQSSLEQRESAESSGCELTLASGEFAARCDKFMGLYEALYRTSTAAPEAVGCRGVLSEWEIRLRHSSAAALWQTWGDTVQAATGRSKFGDDQAVADAAVIDLGSRWQQLLFDWGMERDGRTDFTYTDNERERYWIEGNPEVTDRFAVIMPCWTREGTVIEHGSVRQLEVDDERLSDG